MLIALILFVIVNSEDSFAEDLQINEECGNSNNSQKIVCNEHFRSQSVSVFGVVDSSIGIFEDPDTKLTIVDLGSFYGIGGNGTIPDEIKAYRNNILWKTTTKETGIAPSTSHSEWQIPQTFFFNELPGKYKLVLITNNTETLIFEFIVKQITNEFIKNDLDINKNNTSTEDIDLISSKLPPLKQILLGISPNEIVCRENFQLVFKTLNDSPACVKPKTAEKLIERDWAYI